MLMLPSSQWRLTYSRLRAIKARKLRCVFVTSHSETSLNDALQLLYSIYSKACLINAEYLDPTFDKVFDIFSTQSLTSAQFIEEQFRNANGTFRWYDSQNLNNSGEIVNATIRARTPSEPNYLLATLRAYNATGDDDAASPTSTSTGAPNDPGSSTNTSLAMCVSHIVFSTLSSY